MVAAAVALVAVALVAVALEGGATAGAGIEVPDAGPSRAAQSVAATGSAAGSATPSAVGSGTLPVGASLVATARAGSVVVRLSPGGQTRRRLANPTALGGPLTFLVVQRRPGWVRVQLPERPNGSTGWVADDEVTVTMTAYRLVAHRRRHRLEVWFEGRLTATYPVGIGVSVTPTPSGTYFLTELLAPPDPAGAYGPYAFGLSAFSPTLTTFAGGPGQLGLHGTDAPRSVGTDVSHGCLRVSNAVITVLAHELPLGTPIDITE